MFNNMRKLLLLTLAITLVLVGLVTFMLPIPLGVAPLIIGLAILMMVSPAMRRRFHRLRQRYPSFDARLKLLEPHLPLAVQKILRPEGN
jgi:Flp pilus assembly protein TadB